VSPRALRWLLWLAALAALPLPLLGASEATVPALHQLQLGALALAFTLLERAQGMGPLIAALFLGQGLLWAALLFAAAALAARLLARLPPFARTRLTVLIVALGLALAAAQPIYRTPYSSRSAESSLLGVYW
jgi:hypothetical protein